MFRFGLTCANALPKHIMFAASIVLASAFASPVATQERLVVELEEISAVVLGDWYDVDTVDGDHTEWIRLEPNGRFLFGTLANFGQYPTRWEARRLHLVSRESLVIHWPNGAFCAYYVTIERSGGFVTMHWQPDRDDRDFGPFDGIITRAVMPWGNCAPTEWRRPRSSSRP